jgi:hypothetical protein
MSKKNPAIIKRGKKSDWEKSNYIPEENVIILMDNVDGSVSLMVGDGETNVNKLPDLINDKPFTRAMVNEQDILIL